jgi:hypothetical protein
VASLGPDTSLSEAERASVADYLLGQQAAGEAEETRSLIAASESAQAWASTVAGALTPLGGDKLPDIPGSAPEAAAEVAEPAAPEPEPPAAEPEPEPPAYEEPPASEEAPAYADEPAAYEAAAPEAEEAATARDRSVTAPARPSSRLGGALLLGGVGIVVAVILILLINGGGDDNSSKKSNTLSSNPSTQTTPGNAQQRPVAQVNLTSTSGDSKQVGLAQVFENGKRRAIIVAGQGLDPGAYALWVYNSKSDAKLLGFVPERVGKDGRFATQGELPSDAEKFKQLIVTKEKVTNDTKQAPDSPGDIVLEGNLKLGN